MSADQQPTLPGLTEPITVVHTPRPCQACLGFGRVRVPLPPTKSPFGLVRLEAVDMTCPACGGTR